MAVRSTWTLSCMKLKMVALLPSVLLVISEYLIVILYYLGVTVVSRQMLPGNSFHGLIWGEKTHMRTSPADSHSCVRSAAMLQCVGNQKPYILLYKCPFLKNSCCVWICGAGHLAEDLREILLCARRSSFKKAQKHAGGAVGRRGQGERVTS